MNAVRFDVALTAYILAAAAALASLVWRRDDLSGVARLQRWNAGPPLVEDWGSPHLDIYAAREGYWRSTPSLAHLLPPDAEGHA